MLLGTFHRTPPTQRIQLPVEIAAKRAITLYIAKQTTILRRQLLPSHAYIIRQFAAPTIYPIKLYLSRSIETVGGKNSGSTLRTICHGTSRYVLWYRSDSSHATAYRKEPQSQLQSLRIALRTTFARAIPLSRACMVRKSTASFLHTVERRNHQAHRCRTNHVIDIPLNSFSFKNWREVPWFAVDPEPLK